MKVLLLLAETNRRASRRFYYSWPRLTGAEASRRSCFSWPRLTGGPPRRPSRLGLDGRKRQRGRLFSSLIGLPEVILSVINRLSRMGSRGSGSAIRPSSLMGSEGPGPIIRPPSVMGSGRLASACAGFSSPSEGRSHPDFRRLDFYHQGSLSRAAESPLLVGKIFRTRMARKKSAFLGRGDFRPLIAERGKFSEPGFLKGGAALKPAERGEFRHVAAGPPLDRHMRR